MNRSIHAATLIMVPVLLLALAGSALAGLQQSYTKSDGTLLYAKPSGTAVATLYDTTPLVSLATHGAWSQVEVFGWSRGSVTSIIFADTGAIGSAILAARATGITPRPLYTRTDANTGVTWTAVTLTGWVETSATLQSRSALWQSTSKLYGATCSVCHALHQPQEFTSQQWPGNIKPMFPKTSLTTAQQNLILHYLQWHARDIPANLQH